ncbi:hypothetical protein BFW38_12515 [Terasakiispira papahanaumokuakeensis]|uniref:VacJ n=1 Tax=Terasakiispira papahanaumokuakeensis TaxID=197479 RepID=A0A1E2VB75_9GAMM|nr:hypothetical protein [Terasakiispira papahanaumokuakeensis]ODC04231.1 hypothetical protein BFW38_12515 [Terasakiispira papahanaumokuakeensis]
MKMLNRSAISVRLKQPFVDWVNGLDNAQEETVTLAEANQEATVYLVPELDGPEDLGALLEERYLDILENEWLSWEEDSRLWPDNPDRELFDRMIEIEPSFMAFDLDEQAPLMGLPMDEVLDLEAD